MAATTPAIDYDRLAKVTALAAGSHEASEKQMCVMEAVAWIARERWTDHPKCACPVLTAFMQSWNDALPDAERTALLLPFIPRLVGTRGSQALEARRATMAADWFVREYTPAWLRFAGLTEHADALAGFPEITSFERTPAIRPALEAAQKAASAAWRAAESAAWSAARGAAWRAAESAAESALKPTTDALQQSALALLDRMISATDEPAQEAAT